MSPIISPQGSHWFSLKEPLQTLNKEEINGSYLHFKRLSELFQQTD